MLPFDSIELITFDCYGTLIDWETGILSVLVPLLEKYDAPLPPGEILARYSELEPEAQSGGWMNYRSVLRSVMYGFAAHGGFSLDASDAHALGDSLPNWRPFTETVPALRALASRYRLAVLSNIDDELFAHSARQLEVPFAEVVTAEQVKSYKPGRAHFDAIVERSCLPPARILHVAESLFHDVAVARPLGFNTVWVNRRQNRPAAATRVAHTTPHLEVASLTQLVETMGLSMEAHA